MFAGRAIRRTAALGLALVAAMTVATPALAACGLTAESVARADAVFVGQLAGVSADGTTATFKVEEIWRGSGLVVGEIAQIDTTNALQRLELPPTGAPASRYLVLANTVNGELHTGDSCEVFPYPWDAGYAAFRPADAPPPSGSETGGSGPPMEVMVLLGLAGLLTAVSLFAFTRTRGPTE
jgi:hypothetical protein